jgi:ribosomal protein S18 acetylase RimI-like enzyme
MNVCTYKSFYEVPERVRQQLSYPAQPNFFLSFDWFSLLFETSLLQTLTPRIYVLLGSGGEPLGALFFGVAAGGVVRRLVSLTNFYTLEYSPSVVPSGGDRSALIGHLVQHIAAERPRWHLVDIKMLKTDMPEAQSVTAQLRKAGFGTHPFSQYENWYTVPSGKTFETYFSERSSQLRNTVTRKQKKLEKTHRAEIKIVRHQSEGLEAAVRDFTHIYNRSWKRPEPFPAFIPTLAAVCAKLGTLRLGVLYVDGKPAAAQLWITTERKAIIYKLAYDEEYRDQGVGSILSREMFRIAIDEDHVSEIDYGVGSELYKKEWMSSIRKIEGVEAYNRKTLMGLLLLSAQAVKPPVAAILQRTSRFMKRWRGQDAEQSRLKTLHA